MKYDIVIVLCAARRQEDKKFPEFQDGKYLGGQTRMEAAAELFKRNEATKFVIVGGYNPKSEYSQKVQDMEKFLKEKCTGILLDPIPSLPCTYHNFIAVFNTWLKEGKGFKNKKIGLLTNFYHFPRALRFVAELRNEAEFAKIPSILPISAESIVQVSQPTMVTEFGAYLLRFEDERQGLRDLEMSNYDDKCTKRNYSKF